MLDFSKLRSKEQTIGQLVAGLGVEELRGLTNEMVDHQLQLLEGCTDADVVFVPEDPQANDTFASNPDVVGDAWTLGHVIVHVTASSEESAALAAELARGVEYHGRSRSEVPWETVTTIAQCRERLEESRRMRLAALEMWPGQPHLDNAYEPWPGADVVNPVGRFVFGLMHDDSHLGQIAEIVRQAKAARS